MGIYLNHGKAAFEKAVNSEIYVDKTEMILYLNSLVNTEQNDVCVSRPRRFGKTMATSVVSAYYDRSADSKELFTERKLAEHAGWDRFLGGFDVIRLDMTEFIKEDRSVAEGLKKLSSRVLADLDEAYPESGGDSDDLVYSYVGDTA